MKKILILIMIVVSFVFSSFNNRRVYAEETLSLNGNKALVMEVNSGRILYASNENEKAYPASMTKMMGMYLVMEAIKENKITMEDNVTCSSIASSMGGTQIYLEEGEVMKVEDLFKAVAINSANDAIVCLGEYIFGSNENFIKEMNSKAKELGMNNTHFNNATGFDDENHYSTTFDMGIIGRSLVKDYPEVLKYSSLTEDYIKGNRNEEFWLVNTNKLLKHCEGMDGLKTGYTSKAGYNLTSTVKRNGIRILTVVMNEKSIQERSQDTIKLVNYAFSKLKIERLLNKGDVVGKYIFPNSMGDEVEICLKEDVDVVLLKEEDVSSLKLNMKIDDVKLPLQKDDIVGYLEVVDNEGNIFIFSVTVNENVEKKSFIKVWFKNILRWVS